ncbi:sugar-binding transcriptional regulator [Clostridium sp. DL1XJH146]
MDNDTSNLIQVAKLYYEENLNQSQIAKKLGVSRPLISNMLTKARNLGIVEIKIKEPYENNSLLLNQLKNIFNIHGGFVVPTSNSPYVTEKSIINQSVLFIKESLQDTKVLGVGWGYLIGEVIGGISEDIIDKSNEGKIVPLIGSASIPNKGYHPTELVRELSEKTGLEPKFMFAPAFPTSEQESELYTNTDNYREIENLWNNLDTVVITIGAYPSVPDQATALRFGDKLHKEGAVGKLLSYFFDKDGRIIDSDDDYAIQIPKNILGKVKRVIAICPSEINTKAVLGALKTGYITHIIITDEKAKAVLGKR